MKTFTWLIPLLFGLNVLFAGCDERGRQPDTRTTPSPSTVPSTSKLSDSDLENAVRTKLENDPQLKSADVSVNADAVRNEAKEKKTEMKYTVAFKARRTVWKP